MKRLRHGTAGSEKPGLLHCDGTIRDLSGLAPDIGGATLSDAGLAKLVVGQFDITKFPRA